MDKQLWYQLRNKRTDTYITSGKTYRSTIRISIDKPNDQNTQLMALFSLSILARWCEILVIKCPDVKSLLPHTHDNFWSVLKQAVTNADPYCNLKFTDSVDDHADIELCIGTQTSQCANNFVCIDSSGWIASCGFNSSITRFPSRTFSVVGVAFAASLGTAEIFRFLNESKSAPYQNFYSLWTNDVDTSFDKLIDGPPTDGLDIGKIHVVGCGSIGSSFTALVPFIKCQGRFHFIDTDFVEPWNTTSSLLFEFEHAVKKLSKAAICTNHLRTYGYWTANPLIDDYSKLSHQYDGLSDESPDVIMCFANENNIWATIQNNYPPLSFHATTSKSWGLNIGRHLPLVDECMVCTFKDVMKINFKSECATAELKSADNTEHTAILPFLAPAAAVIALSELLKTILGGNGGSATLFNMQTAKGRFVSDQTSFGNCYVCQPQRQLYQQFGSYGRYWKFSNR